MSTVTHILKQSKLTSRKKSCVKKNFSHYQEFERCCVLSTFFNTLSQVLKSLSSFSSEIRFVLMLHEEKSCLERKLVGGHRK